MTEDEMVGWHHRLNGHEFEQGPEDEEGQGGLVRGSLWGCKKSDTTERLNNKDKCRHRNSLSLGSHLFTNFQCPTLSAAP